jgi:hypothetical protein
MIKRFGVAVAAGVLASMGAIGAAHAVSPGRLEFAVYRGGEPSGRHAVEVARTTDGFTVRVSIDLKGQVLFFPFSYSHRCTENWTAGRLASMSCTDKENDGPTKTVVAQQAGSGLSVRGPSFNGAAPAAIIPTSWWRPDIMTQSRVLDTRTGQMMPVRTRLIGQETLTIGAERVQTRRYRLTASTTTDVWYDTEGRWVRMTFAVSGQNFEYRLASPRAVAPRLP